MLLTWFVLLIRTLMLFLRLLLVQLFFCLFKWPNLVFIFPKVCFFSIIFYLSFLSFKRAIYIIRVIMLIIYIVEYICMGIMVLLFLKWVLVRVVCVWVSLFLIIWLEGSRKLLKQLKDLSGRRIFLLYVLGRQWRRLGGKLLILFLLGWTWAGFWWEIR